MKLNRSFWTGLSVIILLIGGFYLYSNSEDNQTKDEKSTELSEVSDIPKTLQNSGLNIDYSKTSIPLNQILSGGPGKDGIPALTDPFYTPIDQSTISDNADVIVINNNGETKIFPLSILVWHEIVNDDVGGVPLVVTFCPLCGSSIVFKSTLADETLEFGVSGLLYESNLLMYDRSDSESLWSQSLGEAVVGVKTGLKLELFPFTFMSFAEARIEYSDALVLSEDTGYARNYESNPYSGYENSAQTYFPVTINDQRYPAKEIFYIVPVGGMSVAVRLDKSDGIYSVPDSDIAVIIEKGQPEARWGNEVLPGYYEMWFSWATHNQDSGIILD